MYKILKGQSEVVNPRKADNTIDKILKGQSEAVNPRKAHNILYCQPFYDLRLLIVSFSILYIYLLYCLPFFDLRLLISPLVSCTFEYCMYKILKW
jgi:hypothetical protein